MSEPTRRYTDRLPRPLRGRCLYIHRGPGDERLLTCGKPVAEGVRCARHVDAPERSALGFPADEFGPHPWRSLRDFWPAPAEVADG